MVTAAFRAAGHAAAAFDIRRDGVLQDLTSPQGFLHAVCLCLQVRPGAMAVLAVVRPLPSPLSFPAGQLRKLGMGAEDAATVAGAVHEPGAGPGNAQAGEWEGE